MRNGGAKNRFTPKHEQDHPHFSGAMQAPELSKSSKHERLTALFKSWTMEVEDGGQVLVLRNAGSMNDRRRKIACQQLLKARETPQV